MKKRIIATILLTAIAILTFLSLSGCSYFDRLDKDEAKIILEEKLETSYFVMAAVYGDMLEVREPEKIDESWTVPHYFKVKENSKYTTIAAIKADAEKVFSKVYLEDTLYPYAFDGNDEGMSRFAEDGGVLTVDVAVKKPYNILTDIYPETVEIIKSSRYSAKIKVEGSANHGQTRKFIEIDLTNIDGEWYFGGPTY